MSRGPIGDFLVVDVATLDASAFVRLLTSPRLGDVACEKSVNSPSKLVSRHVVRANHDAMARPRIPIEQSSLVALRMVTFTSRRSRFL